MGNAQAKLASLSDLPEAYRSPIFLRNEVKRLFAAVTAWEEALKALQEKKSRCFPHWAARRQISRTPRPGEKSWQPTIKRIRMRWMKSQESRLCGPQ